MVAEKGVDSKSLEAEFESVKAATKAAEALAPAVLSSPPLRTRKRDALIGVVKRTGSLLRARKAIEEEAASLIDDSCEVDKPEVCADEATYKQAVSKLTSLISKTLRFSRGTASTEELQGGGAGADAMEAGWQTRGKGSALNRNIETWSFAAASALQVLKASKAKGTAEEISAAKTTAAEFIRDGLFRLGPTFVKLGQVVSTRTDILEKEYIEVLKDLQDNVPGFGGEKAKAIVAEELGKPIDQIFDSFDTTPIAAASLGQVHRAVYKGQPVAIKVQRAGLRELFDSDLKNLKSLVKLLDQFDPKSDGADRSYADIYDESAKLLYEEIDYELEAKNCVRFANEFEKAGIDYVKVPSVFWDLTTKKVLTLEFVPSFKLTDIERVEAEGLDRKALAKNSANSFLSQVLQTGYFHCDPHPGNLCVNTEGKLVYYDCGMMNELQPNVAAGFKEACFAVFGGGPFVSELQLAAAGKRLVDALETMGVLAKSADRLAVEKLARYFIRTFKDIQIGKSASNIKSTLGADLQALTEQQVFRFPSTFTFIFRAFASIDGIGKGLDPEYDLTKFAQPFINELTESDSYSSDFEKWADRLGAATGLRQTDIEVALTQPKKVAYLEETLRAIEQGSLKIRVRSLENEQALARLQLSSAVTNKLLVGSLLLNIGLSGGRLLPACVWYAGAMLFGFQSAAGSLKIQLFDKKAAKYESKDFN
eukprot:CAMPEP_0119313344 /NCGR_PEP_ID=MMETSP1333-20130426/28746_1 /TAXON_ID=418940 /ORGANISM="Scyphosphaera apsteinii, Strain RCC1455" /LENGTH=706 /DNA_ID=CAMNT_0007318155 /DNA_START=140 /DNA_END=2260 /DNA_ORIENTATION=+